MEIADWIAHWLGGEVLGGGAMLGVSAFTGVPMKDAPWSASCVIGLPAGFVASVGLREAAEALEKRIEKAGTSERSALRDDVFRQAEKLRKEIEAAVN